MTVGGDASLGNILRDWAAKLVPVLILWGITSEVRLQTVSTEVTRLQSEFASQSASIVRTQELVTKNTILLEIQAKRISNLERDIREVVRLLRHQPIKPSSPN